MTAEPRDSISEITEIPRRTELASLGQFLLATGWGTVAGSIPLLIELFPEANLPWGQLLSGIFFVGLVVGVFVLAGMIAICLPITALLRTFGAENTATYALLGLLAGLLTSTALLEMEGPLALGGTAAGLASGLSWGRWRGRCARQAKFQAEVRPDGQVTLQPRKDQMR